MMELNTYLNFNGDCAEALRFYEQCLGAKIEAMQTHADSPVAGDVPPEWRDRVLHARLIVGNTVLMASDSPPEFYEPPRGIYVSISVEDPAEADRIFTALSEGGTVTMPIGKTFWSARFGMLVDRFGTPWMVNCSRPG